ncbi:hypothetical protein Aglo01_16210 [Actinokineospora globicatena]|nr:hypothetical protein Aglo01_16210 [Actinokineospora globicatena]GLW83973.1 hypothetical protein Aglo02_16130 [Actinokineospora globicatena]
MTPTNPPPHPHYPQSPNAHPQSQLPQDHPIPNAPRKPHPHPVTNSPQLINSPPDQETTPTNQEGRPRDRRDSRGEDREGGREGGRDTHLTHLNHRTVGVWGVAPQIQ